MAPIGPVWRMHRLEILGMLVVAAAVAFPLVRAMGNGEITYAPADCMADRWTTPSSSVCGVAAAVWFQLFQWRLVLFQAVLVIAGAVLGSVVVSREIERGTAQLGWSLRGSRARWLADRVLAMTVLMALLLGVLLAAVALFSLATWVGLDAFEAWWGYAIRGPILLIRGLAAFAVAVLIGAVVGRQVSALLLGALAVLGTSMVLNTIFPLANPDLRAPDTSLTGSEIVGTIVAGIVAVVALGGSIWVVDRRRPYPA